MMLRLSLITASCILLSACQSMPMQDNAAGQPGDRTYAEMVRDTQPPAGAAHEVAAGVLDPLATISGAAQAAPDGYAGTFGMQVRNVGSDSSGDLFLNSELNYREQLNVSVRMSRDVARELASQHGDNWARDIVGKAIEVDGEATREVIWFYDTVLGRTKSYYYQTHIQVSSADQVRLL